MIDSLKDCCLKSGLVSISIFLPFLSVIKLEHLVLVFLGLIDKQVLHLQPTTGVPALEPEPRMVRVF